MTSESARVIGARMFLAAIYIRSSVVTMRTLAPASADLSCHKAGGAMKVITDSPESDVQILSRDLLRVRLRIFQGEEMKVTDGVAFDDGLVICKRGA